MQEKAVQCVHEQLTATGFAVVDGGVAYRLSPHIWSSALNCGLDFNFSDRKVLTTIAERRAATIYTARVEGRDKRLFLLAIDDDDLAHRVKWITGLRITELRVWALEEVAPAPTPVQAGAKVDEPPSYPCLERREWFEARGLKDPLAAERWPARRAPTDVPRGR